MGSCFGLWGIIFAAVALFAIPSYGDGICAAGNLSIIPGTSCMIGDLQFTFGQIRG